MIKKLFRWLGYVPEAELAEAVHEGRVHEAAASRLELQVQRLASELEDVRCELKRSDADLTKAWDQLNSRLAQMAKHLSPLVSTRRDPKDLRRWRVQLDIEFDLFERIVFDYQIKQSSAEFDYLMASLFHQIRHDFSTLLRLGTNQEER